MNEYTSSYQHDRLHLRPHMRVLASFRQAVIKDVLETI